MTRDERLLTLRQVAERTSMGESTVQVRERTGTFPKAVYNGRSKRWKLSDVVKFIDSLPTKPQERNA